MAIGTEFFFELAVAAGIGGLIGVEREHREDNAMVIAGVRTFPLVSVAGFLTAFLERETGTGFLLAVGVAGAFGLALMFIAMRMSAGLFGLTTPVVMVLTFLLGVLIGYGYTFEGVVIGVGATFLLLTKKRLHRFAQVLDDTEILGALQFITILFILLPLTVQLPQGTFGLPWLGRRGIVDPYVILLVVAFVSSLSFASLLAMRKVGPHRGILLSGLLGGLVNSEATTASLAHRAREQEALTEAAVAGSVLATTTMFARNIAVAMFADPSLKLARALAPYLLPLALIGLGLAVRQALRTPEGIEPVRVKNPFAVGPALRFALLFAGLSLITSVAQREFGDLGVYATSLGGFVSAAAVIASVSSLTAVGALPLDIALRTSVLAVAASVAGKLIILRAVNRNVFLRARIPFAVLTAAGLVLAAWAFWGP